MLSGQCLCGQVRYEVDVEAQQEPLSLAHCHCARCRKHHGAAFATYLVVPTTAVRYVTGQSRVRAYRADGGRVRCFCSECGAVTPSPQGDRMIVPAGNLAESDALRNATAAHFCVPSKAPFHQLADEWPRHARTPPGFPGVGEARRVPACAAPHGEDSSPAAGQDLARLQGSCLCGAVGFTVEGAPLRWMQCHCSRCRRGRSAAHGSNAFFARDKFAWTRGQPLVKNYRVPEAERFTVSFCTLCGGAAPAVREGVPFVVVAATGVDGSLAPPTEPLRAGSSQLAKSPSGARPQAHIFVADRACWYVFEDELPQFEGMAPI